MPALLNLITLYREALHESTSEINSIHVAPGMTMDYFHTLTVRNFSSVKEESIKEFLGLNIDEAPSQNRSAIQSIPLYCPASVYNAFHAKYPEVYQNPFLVYRDNSRAHDQNHRIPMPYLSVIEVYISHEIMARLDINAICEKHRADCFDVEDREALKVYNAFYRDLHVLMEGFHHELLDCNPDESFVYCIYESVSVGDFALVIRSTHPETANKAAALLRNRSCKLKYAKPELEKIYDPKTLDVYKTYTILSIIETESERPSGITSGKNIETNGHVQEDGETLKSAVIPLVDEDLQDLLKPDLSPRYVLQGVLSNRYWSISGLRGSDDKGRVLAGGTLVRDILNDEDLNRHIQRLHGKYDFMVMLSNQAFSAIYPILLRYKLDGNMEPLLTGDKPDVEKLLEGYNLNETEKLICETLLMYIGKRFISFVNERYLPSQDTSNVIVRSYNEDICLKPVEGALRPLNDYINKEIRALKKRIRNTREDLQFLNTSRNSLIYSMKALERLTGICSTLTDISEVRIFGLVICRQIQAVLNGYDEYLTYIRDNNDLSVIDYLDKDLRAAIESINSFAQIFLKSTAQAFQMPIYNLESHVSAEKMLTSYSWLLQSLLDWFVGSDFFRRMSGSTQKYLTIMVPEGFGGELSAKSILINVNEKGNASKEKLLTVYCPSFSDLTDFVSSFGILFHEMSLYISFEKSYDRNRMILEYSSWLLFDQTSDQIMRDFRHSTSELYNTVDIQTEMIRIFAESYMSAIFPVFSKMSDVRNLNLMLLIQNVKNTYRRFISRIRFLSDFETNLDAFLNNTFFIMDPDSAEIRKSLETLRDTLVGENVYLFDSSKLNKSIDDTRKLLDSYSRSRDEKKMKASQKSDESSYLAKLLQNYIDTLDDDGFENFIPERNAIQLFYKLFYENLLNYLNLRGKDHRGLRRFLLFLFPEHNRMYKEEEIKRLRRYAATYIINALSPNLELLDTHLSMYRDVTADLYMVQGLGLTPFGYLNFLIRNIPMEVNMADTYIERFCRVLYSLRGEEIESGTVTWQDVFFDLFNGICSFCVYISQGSIRILTETITDNNPVKKIPEVQKILEAFSSLLKEINTSRISFSLMDEMQMADYIYSIYNKFLIPLWENFYPLYKKTENIGSEEGLTELVSILRSIKHAVSLSKAFIQITEQYIEKVYLFEMYPFLKANRFAESRNLNKMRVEMQKTAFMKNYCCKVAMKFNEPIEGGIIDDTESIVQNYLWEVDFILDMHYSMIIEYVSRILDTKPVP